LAYISLYRKWRPQTFEEVIGQEYITRTLSNSLRSGNHAHAYLFAGPRGTGKTSTARILAKALNCEQGPTPNPCNRCPSCRDITAGTSVDIVEIDAASNRGIDDIRDLRERVIFSPAVARTKVYILDEAHMLTPPAFNALLKMLEEPPAHVVFVLATTEPHRMPPTILSRCQRFDFRSVPALHIVRHLARICEEESIEAPEGALRLIARRARGSVRDALVILEQVVSYGDGVVSESEVAGFLGLIEDEILVELGNYMADGDTAGVISLVERAYEEGRDLTQFAREAQEYFRRLFLLQHADLSPEDLELEESVHASLRRQAGSLSTARVHHFVVALKEAIREMQSTASSRLVLEEALISMAHGELDVSTQALSVRLDELERELDKFIRKGSVEGKGSAEAPAEKRRPSTGRAGEMEKVEEKPVDARDRVATTADEGFSGEGPAVPVDLTAVRRAWPHVRERVKEKKITTHAFLLEGKPREVGEGELIVSFPSERSFHQGEMEKEEHRIVLESALEEVLGVRLKVRSRIEEEPPEAKKEGKERHGERTPSLRQEGENAGAPRAADVSERYGGRDELVGAGESGAREEDDKSAEIHDAGKVKLVKDVFGAEMIEEIKLNE
jgi:DNA polymerase-3 subunit gamma/tau